jgi:hypothetical protein
MKRLAAMLAVASVTACADASLPTGAGFEPAMAATKSGSNQMVPTQFAGLIPCGNGGAGESMTLTGELHLISHSAIDAAGGVHLQIHTQLKNIEGWGNTSGTYYRAMGSQKLTSNAKAGSSFSFISSFRLIGRAQAPDYHVRENTHVTVNANGDVVVDRSETSIDCG